MAISQRCDGLPGAVVTQAVHHDDATIGILEAVPSVISIRAGERGSVVAIEAENAHGIICRRERQEGITRNLLNCLND